MTSEKLTATVPEELAGLRLDQALAQLFPDYSRSRLKEWLLNGVIRVEGGPKRPRDAVKGGEQIEFEPQVETEVEAQPEAMALDIAREDDDLLIVNKPAGLVVHPGAGNPSGTLLNGLLHHAPELQSVPRAGIIHRIDKDTSGLLLVAKTIPAHTALVRLLADRDISREYLAICGGVLTGGGTIDEPIGRHPVDRTRMTVQQDGRHAVTHFTVIERFRAHSYIQARLETGRTHQIRVHFAWRRNPLVGDPVYGGRLALPAGASDELVEALRGFRRQALHAARLAFEHPTSGEAIEIEVPPPDDFMTLLDVMRRDNQQ